jgi:hypothetical protein
MFEPVANEIYMKRYNTFIHEFGLIKHPNKDFFGASPDGITNNGIMVEIKCPFKRKITGEIPLQYYYQIQGQLDVCDLEECDYFECEFSLYSGEYDFYNDDTNVEKGMIIEYLDPVDESTQYIYSDIFYSQVDNQMVDDWIVNNSNLKKVVDIKFYKLQKLNTQRVYRNNEFIKEKIDELEEIWKKVIEYRNNKDLYNEEICSKKKVIKKQPVYAFLD